RRGDEADPPVADGNHGGLAIRLRHPSPREVSMLFLKHSSGRRKGQVCPPGPRPPAAHLHHRLHIRRAGRNSRAYGFFMPTSELTVRQLMIPEPAVLRPDTPVQDALHVMNQRRIGSVLVCNDTGQLLGIFTERDLLKPVVTALPGWRDFPLATWMTADPHTIGPDVGWNDAVAAMQKLRVRHLPVIE